MEARQDNGAKRVEVCFATHLKLWTEKVEQGVIDNMIIFQKPFPGPPAPSLRASCSKVSAKGARQAQDSWSTSARLQRRPWVSFCRARRHSPGHTLMLCELFCVIDLSHPLGVADSSCFCYNLSAGPATP